MIFPEWTIINSNESRSNKFKVQQMLKHWRIAFTRQKSRRKKLTFQGETAHTITLQTFSKHFDTFQKLKMIFLFLVSSIRRPLWSSVGRNFLLTVTWLLVRKSMLNSLQAKLSLPSWMLSSSFCVIKYSSMGKCA